MKQLIQRLKKVVIEIFSWNTIVQFIKFGIIGFFNTVISYAIYASLVYLDFHYIFASFIDILHISKYIAPFFGLVITVPLNFILNKKWAFSAKNNNI